MADLTTLEIALGWLGLPSDDASGNVARLITSVSAQIEKFLGYAVLSATYTKTFDGAGGSMLILPDRPVTAVASVSLDGVAQQPSTSFCNGFAFTDKAIILRGGNRFCAGFQNVTATYTAGYDAVPADIQQACLDWVNGYFAGKDRDPAIVSQRAGDTEQKYASVTTLGSIVVPMPASVFAVLGPYQRVEPV